MIVYFCLEVLGREGAVVIPFFVNYGIIPSGKT